nr:PAS domain-containing sensor histidine kinase [Geminicoccus harenae]
MADRTVRDGHRVLIAAPFGRDASTIAELLQRHGYEALPCADIGELAGHLDDHVGLVLLTEEALKGDLNPLQAALAEQPTWSEVPIVLLTAPNNAPRQSRAELARARLPPAAVNVVVLERPIGAASLLSTVAWAMRARQKQFDLRDHLVQLAESERALRESQAALRASETEMRLVADSLPVLIAFVDRGLIYRFANRAYQDWVYRPPEEVVGRSVLEVIGSEGLEARQAAIERALAGEPTYLELPWPHRDGRRRDADIRYLPRRNGTGEVDGFYVFALDVTERKQAAETLRDAAATLEARVRERTAALEEEMASRLRLEAALRQSQKMEAVGQLTGGIAHDFNNMLTGIIGSIDVLKRRIRSNRLEDAERFMDAALASASRAANLTHRLLAFSRRQSLDPKPVDINRLIGSLEELIGRTLNEQISLEMVLGHDLPPAVVDANQLENATLNLTINARDAMPEGGSLTIGTREVVVGTDAAAERPGLEPGRYLALTVSDTGVGIAPELLDKVYDPFFTTKPIGQGTGLGLSMVYGFAQQSDGQVRIDTQLGRGTAVTIYLPAAAEAVAEEAPAPAEATMPPAPGWTILLVEDDASVRMLTTDLLHELGYRAIEAAEAQAAMAILRSPRPLAMMISDVGLPGMNGRQLAEIARQDRPDLPILFITGYAENAAIRSGFLGTGMAMITKPFSVDVLAAKVRDMLDGRPAG